MAIIIVTVVAVVTGLVLTRGDGSLRATIALRDAARSSYAADGAAQVAINALRTGYNTGTGEPTPWYYTNAVGTGCFGYNGSGGSTTPLNTLAVNNVIPKETGDTQSAMSAAVECEAEDATGEQGSAVPINSSNKPGNAILTLGTSGAEDGFTFKTNGSGAAFRVKGGIWSNSTIFRDNNGNLESSESIRAHTGCTPIAAMIAPVVNCSASTTADPNYQSDLDIAGTGIPTLQTPPASCPNNGTVTLSPGYYDDVTKLNALTNTNSQCFIHLQPGPYYFDFHNNSVDTLFDSDIAAGGGNVWTIGSRKTVIGGTLTADTTVPGRCVNPIDDVNAAGVQLIFGGDSRMLIEANGQDTEVEFCATYHTSRPPIAIYGQKTGTATLTDVSGGSALTVKTGTTPTVTAAGTHGTFTGATPPNLQSVDGDQATDANLAVWRRTTTNAGNQTRSITMNGFETGTSLPKGTVLKSAVLKVTHRNTSTGSGQVNRVTLTPTGGSALTTTALPARANLTTDTVDLATLGSTWGAFQQRVHDFGYTGADVNFESTLTTATSTGGPTPVITPQVAQLDAVRLEMTYYLPGLRGQTTAAIPSNTVATVGGAAVVQLLGNSTTFYVQGTTYTPLAKIDLSLNNLDESVFRFGVIARSLVVFETGSFSFPGAVIELPDNSPGFGFETTLVRLKVYLCPGVTSGCTAGTGEFALEARVKVFDTGGVPGPPNRQISVLNWSHQR
ncbi:hypothetical protein [Nocardioides sp. WS12]|uniref:hypothetical protein n=1 Tax=Nocardioides sp. WS12 TaxID=2486272 RepID=UPI0015FE487D|nr:hypothetical protein [Nocardioides sp. WS12]